MSVIADFGVSVNQPSVVQTALTQLAFFPRLNASLTNPASVRLQSLGQVSQFTPNINNATGQLVWPNNNALTGQIVRIQLAGNISVATGGVSAKISLFVQSGVLSVPVYNQIATTGNAAVNSVNPSWPWSLEAVVVADPLSGVLGGQYSAVVANAYSNSINTNAWVPLDNAFVYNFAATPNGANTTQVGLVAAVTFTVGNAANTARLTQFQISAA